MNCLNLRAINKNSYEWWVVSLLALPVYFFILIDNHPYVQFVCYLGYFLALFATILSKKTLRIPKSFMIGWLFFLFLLFVPSYINYYSGRLESELINLPVIAVKLFLLTSILFVIIDWVTTLKPSQSFDFYRKLFIVIAPLSVVLILAILVPRLLYPDDINYPTPYGMHHNYLGEILILFILLATQLKEVFLKYLALFFGLLAVFYLSSRGTLLGVLVGLFFILIWPSIKKYPKQSLIVTCLLIASLPFTYSLIYELVDTLFLISSNTRGFEGGITGRWDQYLRAISLIKDHWLLGVGFDASIPFNFMGNGDYQIHNLFLRILAENGIGLFILVLAFISAAAINIERLNLNFERGCFYALIALMMFQPRHINLNLMCVFFYIIIIRSLYSKPYKVPKNG
jgi:O-antigen ligase